MKECIEYSNEQMRDLIDQYVHSARDREILKDRLIDGMFFEPLADKHQMSVRQVKNIVYKEWQRLLRHL